jgi:acyl-CoA hydrolase
VHVSPPDKHGFCSLGVSVDIARSAVRNAKYVIAQVNPQMPRTLGDGMIHLSEIQAMVEVDDALPEMNYADSITEVEIAIGKHCASLIEDRSTLQMGIGAIPDAVLRQLQNHHGLGIHSEMFSDGIIDLVENGIITNQYKKSHRGKLVSAFALGTRRLYDYIHDNPRFAFLEADYVNDTAVIRKNPKMIAINSAIEIDITGQVCADSIGTTQFSGVGGQMDFIRGAALSEDGKAIIALSSVTKKGKSKIVPFLKEGAGVVTTRAHVHYVVTEYGIANLYGRNLRQRAYDLLEIAHPDCREELEREIFKRFGGR